MQGGSGYAKNITFEDITLKAVKNPIIIDQYYCENSHSCKNQVTILLTVHKRVNRLQFYLIPFLLH